MGRIRVFLGLVAALGLAVITVSLPPLLQDVDLFRVTGYRLEGATYLTLEEAVRAAAVPAGASIWDDREPWEAALETHPLVESARVRRRPPGTLVLDVSERTPIALLPTPVLEPVDHSGRKLPIDPAANRLDLPVVRPTRGPDRDELTPEELTRLVSEIQRLADADPEFFARLSDVARDEHGDVLARAGDPDVMFRYRPPLAAQRLRDGLLVLDDVVRRSGRAPRTIDLRYVDQVVVGF